MCDVVESHLILTHIDLTLVACEVEIGIGTTIHYSIVGVIVGKCAAIVLHGIVHLSACKHIRSSHRCIWLGASCHSTVKQHYQFLVLGTKLRLTLGSLVEHLAISKRSLRQLVEYFVSLVILTLREEYLGSAVAISQLRVNLISLLSLAESLVQSPLLIQRVVAVDKLLIHHARIFGMSLSLVCSMLQRLLHVGIGTGKVAITALAQSTRSISVHLLRELSNIVGDIAHILG